MNWFVGLGNKIKSLLLETLLTAVFQIPTG